MTRKINISRTIVSLLLLGILQSSNGAITKMSIPEKSDLSELADEIDMGVDYNDDVVPEYMKNALVNITTINDSVTKEYGEFLGTLRLIKAIASLYSKLIKRTLNPKNEVIVTASGTEALFITIRGLTSIGDEWIIIEPFYTPFERQLKLANGVPRFTSLKPTKIKGNLSAADWHLDRAEMRRMINSKTRGIIFNNPNNPIGKNYERNDLEYIAYLAKRYNLLVIADEVHEFKTDPMIKMASLPGMFERTVTIGSASKAFGVPGWRAGWAYGPAEFIERLRKVHADVVGFAALPIQEALAVIFENEVKNYGTPQAYLPQSLANVKRQRDFILQAFRDAGMAPIAPQGGTCMLVGWPKFQTISHLAKVSNLAEWLSSTIRIHAFNAGNYYSKQHQHLGNNHLRFCYHKSNMTLHIAAERLRKLKV